MIQRNIWSLRRIDAGQKACPDSWARLGSGPGGCAGGRSWRTERRTRSHRVRRKMQGTPTLKFRRPTMRTSGRCPRDGVVEYECALPGWLPHDVVHLPSGPAKWFNGLDLEPRTRNPRTRTLVLFTAGPLETELEWVGANYVLVEANATARAILAAREGH